MTAIDVHGSDGSMVDAVDDRMLVAALVARDASAPLVLWRRFAPPVFRILRRMLGPTPDVDDLVQEVFLCVLRKASALRECRALRAFIISTAILVARSEMRRARRRGVRELPFVQDPSADVSTLSAVADAREALARFRALLERFKPIDRTAFVLRFVEGMRLTDLATRLGMSLSTVKRRLARIRARVFFLVKQDSLLSQYPVRLAKSPTSRSPRAGRGSRQPNVGIHDTSTTVRVPGRDVEATFPALRADRRREPRGRNRHDPLNGIEPSALARPSDTHIDPHGARGSRIYVGDS
jgi:RNA polymerase sigma-70 factor (ECF subfamily)